jgi:hypothetical protein
MAMFAETCSVNIHNKTQGFVLKPANLGLQVEAPVGQTWQW